MKKNCSSNKAHEVVSPQMYLFIFFYDFLRAFSMKKISLTPPGLGVPDCLWTGGFTFGCVGLDQLRGLRGQMGQMGQMAPNEKNRSSSSLQLWFFSSFQGTYGIFFLFCDMKSVKLFFPCGASCQRLYWKKGTWIIGCFLFGSKKNLWGCSVGKHLSDNQTNAIPKGSSLIHHVRTKPSSLTKKKGHSAGFGAGGFFHVFYWSNPTGKTFELSHEPTILPRCLVFDQPWSEKKTNQSPTGPKGAGWKSKAKKKATQCHFRFVYLLDFKLLLASIFFWQFMVFGVDGWPYKTTMP